MGNMGILISTRKIQMVNEEKARWKNLNWAKGLDRIYYIAWALIAIKAFAEFIDDKNFGVLSLLLVGVVMPFAVRQLAIWVAKGFQK